jgi:hypothetical protein
MLFIEELAHDSPDCDSNATANTDYFTTLEREYFAAEV